MSAPLAHSSKASVAPPAGPAAGAPQSDGDQAHAAHAAAEDGDHRWASALAGLPWAAWLTSTVVHASLLVILSLMLLASPQQELLWLTGSVDATDLDDMEIQFDEIPADAGQPSLGSVVAPGDITLPGAQTDSVGNVRTGPATAGGDASGGTAPAIDPLAPAGDEAAGSFASEFEPLSNPLATRGGGLQGRTLENRMALALAGGGTRESEAAVELGLQWMAEHQFDDGAWRFNLEIHPRCAGYCRDSGTYTTSTAATGLALLSFLGAGYTHHEGKYQEVVQSGLYYLQERMSITSRGGDLRDTGAAPEAEARLGFAGGINLPSFRRDTMYSHAIATLAITEAYAMTRDPALRQPAEEAIQFIIEAQYEDGGWRYNPAWENQGPGDMTVTGWQLMALKSGLLAGIDVPYEVWIRASAFIDGLQKEGGASYTYVAGERGTTATTAVGLLCRMVGGWPREAKPLQQGVLRLGEQLPTNNNMYCNYYAAQVLHHVGGPRWERWNPKMREYLVGTQSHEGHETGSWYFPESHSTPGGRLYTTALAIMTLEVYYRYMPLYNEPFVGRAP